MFGCLDRRKGQLSSTGRFQSYLPQRPPVATRTRASGLDKRLSIASGQFFGLNVFIQSYAERGAALCAGHKIERPFRMQPENALLTCFEGTLENADSLKEALFRRHPELTEHHLSINDLIRILVSEKRARGVERQASIEMLRMELAGSWNLSIVDPFPLRQIRLYALTSTQAGLRLGANDDVTWFDTEDRKNPRAIEVRRGELAIIERRKTTVVSTDGIGRVVLQLPMVRCLQTAPEGSMRLVA